MRVRRLRDARSSLTILDSYSVPGYLSTSPARDDAPVRYLETGILPSSPVQRPAGIEPLEPPNIIQGLSAALMTEASL
jgi:hypothetical protein